MGNKKSTPPPPKEFDQEWRKTDWSKQKRNAMVDELKNLNLDDPEVGLLRCLLIGPVGAGKSSFIDSVNNIFQGRITQSALVASISQKSFTKKYKTHYIKNGANRLPIAFNDIMGLENEDECGIHPDDIINALKGHLKEGYMFNPSAAITTEDLKYNSNPSLSDQVHCLVNVMPADKIQLMSEKVLTKMKMIRGIASELGIPQVVVMTMTDKACPLVNNDLKKIYTSMEIKKKMQMCSNELGVPVNCILPVKNYHEEGGLDNDVDILILNAFSQIVHHSNDYIWDCRQNPRPSRPS
ncbi:interferon-induced protein 44-like [Esox lucius]|uniref:G domain-containing protein n=1 Tax=Esox lucius TaxID=8010 RepID=A0A3P8XY15_ESOLU|nr:interferon-induced protein 44-like [Esox lucius]